MSDLIERLEQAGGPDRVLDTDIYRDVVRLGRATNHDALTPEQRRSHFEAFAPKYTASIDAALTLIPANWYATIAARADGPTCVLQEFPQPCRRVPDAPYVIRTGCSPNNQQHEIALAAITVCICALKARALSG